MSRVDELQKRYPSIPRDVIVKKDVLVQGVKDDGDIDKVSDWKPSPSLYQTYDYDVTLQELAESKPWRVRPGQMLRPGEFLFRSGLGAKIRLRSTSPYVIREEGAGRYALCEGEEKIEEIYFPRSKSRTTPEPLTSKGTPISSLIEFRRRCFRISPVRYCEYFARGQQCKFCNFNASQDDARSAGFTRLVTLSLEETVEAYKIRGSEARFIEGSLVMGGFMDAKNEARIYVDFVENIANAASYKPNLTVHTQAMDRKDMQRLKDVGLDCLVIQLEVMEPRLFDEMCPGKAKHAPYERWLEAIQDAVDVFGPGWAGCKLVPGLTMMTPNGHATWQEARDYHIEADHWVTSVGAFPSFYAMWWAQGSVISEDKSNLQKFPPTEYQLEVAQAHHDDFLKYGLYDKMNKFMNCALDCSMGPYMGDIGMLTIAGDVGNWMSNVVPAEANWLAQFIASLRPRARTQ